MKCEICGRQMTKVMHKCFPYGHKRKHWHCKKCGIFTREMK